MRATGRRIGICMSLVFMDFTLGVSLAFVNSLATEKLLSRLFLFWWFLEHMQLRIEMGAS
jgi:hypothetical protein